MQTSINLANCKVKHEKLTCVVANSMVPACSGINRTRYRRTSERAQSQYGEEHPHTYAYIFRGAHSDAWCSEHRGVDTSEQAGDEVRHYHVYQTQTCSPVDDPEGNECSFCVD